MVERRKEKTGWHEQAHFDPSRFYRKSSAGFKLLTAGS
jgi:hypothetical protein